MVNKYWLPTIGAAIALQRKDAAGAIELLKASTPVELGQALPYPIYLCPAYIRGEAYLVLGQGYAARQEFQKFLDHRGLIANFPLGALAQLGLARTYALDATTDPSAREKARTAYRDFLTLWQTADPDIPVYRQAKAEYAKLQ
jgi:eukaryotic-like serine/threonine-protein kinase